MTEQEELRILRDFMMKLGNAQIASMKDGGKRLGNLLTTLRYEYCYPLTNSNAGEDETKIRITTLNNLDKT